VFVTFTHRWSALALLLALTASTPAQESRQAPPKPEEKYRDYFKQPETPQEYWAAMSYEIEVGKFNLAAQDLKGFLAKNPSDEELLQIEEQEGMSAFLKLLTIPELRNDAKPLLERVTAAVRKLRSDPERIRRFVQNLSATPEERAYAIRELRKSGAVVVPYLIDGLRAGGAKETHDAILMALVELGPEAVPPLGAALESGIPSLQLELIDVVRQRREAQAVPYLRYPSATGDGSDLVRRKAIQTISEILGTEPARLPPAKEALTQEAERYYQHRVRFGDPQTAAIWEWDGNHVVARKVPASQAEEFYGLHFAKLALQLDPSYEPAQLVFLSVALDKALQKSGVDQPADAGVSSVKELLRVVNPALINATLDRALEDHRIPVILGTVRALGDFGDSRALNSSAERTPPLVRALYFPDRRVQIAAADAVLRIPNPNGSHYSTRIVEILRRAALTGPLPRVLIGSSNADRGNQVARIIRTFGYDTEVRTTGRTMLQRLAEASDIDLIWIEEAIADPPLPYLLAQLRADINSGLLPIIVTAPTDPRGNIPADLQPRLERLVAPYRNTWVMPSTLDAVLLRHAVDDRIVEASGSPMTAKEHTSNAALAMAWLKRLAVGEVPGYDVRTAADAILKALHTEGLALAAIEAAGKLPGRKAQHELANVVLRELNPEIRTAAAVELAHHIQQHDSALVPQEEQGIRELYAATTEGKLKSALALVLGSQRPNARETGERLKGYRPEFKPAPAPPPAAAPEKEK
jgi:hypothetical protein